MVDIHRFAAKSQTTCNERRKKNSERWFGGVYARKNGAKTGRFQPKVLAGNPPNKARHAVGYRVFSFKFSVFS